MSSDCLRVRGSIRAGNGSGLPFPCGHSLAGDSTGNVWPWPERGSRSQSSGSQRLTIPLISLSLSLSRQRHRWQYHKFIVFKPTCVCVYPFSLHIYYTLFFVTRVSKINITRHVKRTTSFPVLHSLSFSPCWTVSLTAAEAFVLFADAAQAPGVQQAIGDC